MIKKFPWLMLSLVLGWKIALFLFTAQPVPANDAFFYDGAVIHKLLHGGYYNPSLAQALKISGTQLYSTYPPFYQAVLYFWLSIFGVSALNVMVLHLILFAIYGLTLYALLRRWQLAAWPINLACAFLFAITFHDRPDSLAHCLGFAAIYFWARYGEARRARNSGVDDAWFMSLGVVLALGTSLQIGGIYFGVILCANAFAWLFNRVRPPWTALAGMFLLPAALVLLVKLTWPLAGAGFLEHARQTPSFTGLRLPHWPELAKIIRTVPGVLLAMVCLPRVWRHRQADANLSEEANFRSRSSDSLLLATLLGSLAVILLSLFVLTPNTIAIAGYLQPIIVALVLGSMASQSFPAGARPLPVAGFILAALLASIRAIGMTTWGAACADDVSYRRAAKLVENAIAREPAGTKIVMSSAFLYDAARHQDVEMIHSDWLARAGGNSQTTDFNALLEIKPAEMILTQFDYYRRFEKVLGKLQETPGSVPFTLTNTARIRAPDSFKAFQQVVQNVSWAPVVVTFSWAQQNIK